MKINGYQFPFPVPKLQGRETDRIWLKVCMCVCVFTQIHSNTENRNSVSKLPLKRLVTFGY